MIEIKEKESSGVQPVKMHDFNLTFSEIIKELNYIFLDQKEVDKSVYNVTKERSIFKNGDIHSMHPLSYICDLMKVMLEEIIDQENDTSTKAFKKSVANKSLDNLKDMFLTTSVKDKTKCSYIFFAYVIGMLECLELYKSSDI